MTNEKIFDLTQELLERMEVAKKEAKNIRMKLGDEDLFFVHSEDGEKEYVNPKYLSFEKHCMIKQLADFIRFNKDVNDENLKDILSMNKTRLGFLSEVQAIVPNLVEECRTHYDEKYVSYLYATNVKYAEKENNAGC